MAWSIITGPGTTTATKFHGDVMNKINNMFNGTDISDNVTIHANTLWTMGNQTMTGRFQTDKGADVASPVGGIMTLGTDGNVFDVTGTNTINEILGTTWTLGAQIVLQFDDVLTVTHNSGGTNDILLGNAANFTTAAGNTLSLFYNGTDWVETSRNVGDGAGDALVANGLDQFAATTSAQLAGVLSDETGTGSAVFATSPTITTPAISGNMTTTGTIDGRDVATDGTKLDGIEALADVTDLTNVNAAAATTVGTVDTGTWQGTKVASAYLDDDTAHLSTTQTFTGAKTFDTTTTVSGIDADGTNIDNIQNLIHDLSTSGTDIDFAEDELQEISIYTNTTFTGTGYAIGKTKVLKITNDATLHTLAFPSGWTFVGTKPTDIASSKTAILTITCFTALESGAIAAYAVEE